MTFIEALEKASKTAQKTKSFRHVLVENSMFSDYEIASDFDLDNWFLGSEPLASFGPDGMRIPE
jgi:hypothetical protein